MKKPQANNNDELSAKKVGPINVSLVIRGVYRPENKALQYRYNLSHTATKNAYKGIYTALDSERFSCA